MPETHTHTQAAAEASAPVPTGPKFNLQAEIAKLAQSAKIEMAAVKEAAARYHSRERALYSRQKVLRISMKKPQIFAKEIYTSRQIAAVKEAVARCPFHERALDFRKRAL